jgi:predicted ribosome quality control (RQC) complex YloA/Tae2 family protein
VRQIELAEKFGIKYPSPGGGCLLCEKEFAIRLMDLFKNDKEISYADTELLKIGRHFRINGTKIVVGRNEQENKRIMQLADGYDLLVEPKDIVGPTTLIRSKHSVDEETIKKASGITARYSDAKDEKVGIVVKNSKGKKEIKCAKMLEPEIDLWRIK